MSRRLGLGPVFAFEWLTSSRRWQVYALRSAAVLVLMLVMLLIWADSPGWTAGGMSIQRQAQIGRMFFIWTSLVLLGIVGLAAPGATAGAICLDKARGNLTLLFATDLSDPEIVLGKLAARLVPVLGLILCAAPVLALATLFGGVSPVGLFGALLVILAVAVFGCSLALTLSVWGQKTHEVLLGTYALGILYLLAAPIWAGITSATNAAVWPSWAPTFLDLLQWNPVYLVVATIEPMPGGRPVGLVRAASFFGLGLLASVVLVAVATLRVRRVVVAQLGRGAGAARPEGQRPGFATSRRWVRPLLRYLPTNFRFLPVPSLDRNPVLWRECQRRRPSRWTVSIWGLYALLAGGFSLWVIGDEIRGLRAGSELGAVINALQVSAGLLLLSVTAATGLAEERQRGSLDVLLATPLRTAAIVHAKWWATFRGAVPLALLPTAVASATVAGRSWHFIGPALIALFTLAYGAFLTSLGLALATWMPRLGRAVGLCVGIYLFLLIAAIPLVMVVFDQGPWNEEHVAAISPFWALGAYTASLSLRGPGRIEDFSAWIFFYAMAYVVVAGLLYWATLATFDRCLGRMPDPHPDDDRTIRWLDEDAAAGDVPAPAELATTGATTPADQSK